MISYKQKIGYWGEEKAAEFLSARGYSIVDHNYRSPYGEIDLIAEKDGEIIFIEVKTRRGEKYGFPEDAITLTKRSHLVAAASYYIQSHFSVEVGWRIDVIAIRKSKEKGWEIIHYENAFSGEEELPANE